MSAPQVSNAFIDLATYGELEKRLYSVGPSNRVKNRKIILFIMLIFFLIYIKG
jgi:hypothetical protein